jgi:hypothetical protein
MARNLDRLAELQALMDELGPLLQTAINEGWNAEKIYNHPKVQAKLAARAVMIGLMEADSGRAMAAIKDIQDRSIGKPTEKQEITHKASKLSDEELDALIATKLQDSEDSDVPIQ